MKITQAEFVTSAVKPDQYPTNALPEFALAGRSNVGKSSLINALIGRKNLARTSGTPGKTQTINFYCINQSFYFADVPGYGFARVSKRIRQAWGRMMETYFEKRSQLRVVMQVVDLRHPPSADDQMMYQYLYDCQIPRVVVATKADKIAKGKRDHHLKIIRTGLSMDQLDPLVLFSAETKLGKNELWSILQANMNRNQSRT